MKGIEFFEDDGFWQFGAMYKKRTVAVLKADVLDEKTVVLGDIQVYSRQHHRKNCSIWKRCFIRTDFRGEGIARAMMKSFLTKAKRGGFTQVIGDVNESDPKETNYLLAWYTRLGFDVRPNEDSRFKYSIKKKIN